MASNLRERFGYQTISDRLIHQQQDDHVNSSLDQDLQGLTADFFDDDDIYTLGEGSPLEESLSQDVPDILTPPPLPPPLPEMAQYEIPPNYHNDQDKSYYGSSKETTRLFNTGSYSKSISSGDNAGIDPTRQPLMNRLGHHYEPATNGAATYKPAYAEDKRLVNRERGPPSVYQPSSKRYRTGMPQPCKPSITASWSTQFYQGDRELVSTSHPVKPNSTTAYCSNTTGSYVNVPDKPSNSKLYQSGHGSKVPRAMLPAPGSQQYVYTNDTRYEHINSTGHASTSTNSTTGKCYQQGLDYHQCPGQPSLPVVVSSVAGNSTASCTTTRAEPAFFTSSSNVR